MTIFNGISLLGGLALFLFGMSTMTTGLEKISGGRLEAALEKMTNNLIKSIGLGLVVTAAIQSSSATTVIVVGLVNAGILKLRQAIGIIMGANIGTTVTAHIIRMTDIQGGSLLLNLLKPTSLAPIAAVIGILLYYASKKPIRKDIGVMLLGFSVLFTGMFAMESAVKPLQDVPEFTQMFSTFSNPVLGVLVGTVVTAVIQSSSASVGILQALASTGAITFSAAFPIIMGQNIGTCITPILASFGASKNAKRTAFVHVMFNVVGTLVFLLVIYAIQGIWGFSFWNDPITKGGIANFHTVFNLTVTVLFIPFTWLLEKAAYFFIKPTADENKMQDEFANLDDRFLASPGFAIQHARETVVRMSTLALENYKEAVELLHDFDKKKLERIREKEDIIDHMQSRVDMYLLKLSKRELTDTENMLLSEVLQVVNEFERIGDHDDNLCDCAVLMAEKGITFSPSAWQEMNAITDAVEEIVEHAASGYAERDVNLAQTIEPLEEVINILVETLKVRHNERLQSGKCNVDAAFAFVEILYDLERIADHCSNVGVHIISYSDSDKALDRHDYLRKMRSEKTAEYQTKVDMYDKKYFGRIVNVAES